MFPSAREGVSAMPIVDSVSASMVTPVTIAVFRTFSQEHNFLAPQLSTKIRRNRLAIVVNVLN